MILRHCRARSHTIIPTIVLEDRRLSLAAHGLFCGLADGPKAAEHAIARFGLGRAEFTDLLREPFFAGLVETGESGS
ncbi:hypothetical protein [Methylobacterium brachiatum]|uniref:hypothetical protein n=1 Tax=Methylobacterium brachiatum TaxID=269660 RepID=UPI00244C8937|nr:hypothetical protein [Methylobacterium brachiatum]MDH2313115.1 hypothetical protein [Methylobacterium brachiatum]